MGLSITIDKLRVFINKTLSTQSLINQLLIKRVDLSIVIDNGKIGQGMRSCKCTNHNLYAGVCQWQWQVCVSDAMVSVCMSRWVSVCVSFLLISFKLGSGCLFDPHHVNQGGVQKATPQVTLYESHNVEESLRRCRSGRNSQVLSGHRCSEATVLLGLHPLHCSCCEVNSLVKNLFFSSFLCFLEDFFPSFLVRGDPIILSSVRCVLLYVSGRCTEYILGTWQMKST